MSALAKVVIKSDSVYQVIAQAILNENTSNSRRAFFFFLGISLAFLECFSILSVDQSVHYPPCATTYDCRAGGTFCDS